MCRKWQDINVQDYIWIRLDENLEMTYPTAPYKPNHTYTEYTDISTGKLRLRVVEIIGKKTEYFKLDRGVSEPLPANMDKKTQELSLFLRSQIAMKANEHKRGK